MNRKLRYKFTCLIAFTCIFCSCQNAKDNKSRTNEDGELLTESDILLRSFTLYDRRGNIIDTHADAVDNMVVCDTNDDIGVSTKITLEILPATPQRRYLSILVG